ncbi:MAG: DNA-processing protein DprA [Patescibacteria group bacterium]
MKWIGISGSWRKTNKEIEEKIRSMVREIITRGDGIVSGGALGVDYIALDEALKHNAKAEKIKIFLPTTLEKYAEHYQKHARLRTITSKQAKDLINQLTKLKQTNPRALIENLDANFTEETKKQMYYQRNSKIVEAADELIAFRVKTEASEGLGTVDAIEKAQAKGIPIKLFSYDLKS